MNRTVNARPFERSDRESCLALFDSNVPAYFAAAERAEFEAFLDAPPGPYWVLEAPQGIVGCGGWARAPAESRCAVLCWGMIDRRSQASGLGGRLLQLRIDRIRDEGFSTIVLNTSQHVRGFFLKFGFTEQERIADGYAPGVDRVTMILRKSA